MAGRGPARCSLCDAPVIWAKTAAKKSMPLDAEPSPAGNCWFENGVVVVASKAHPKPVHGRFFTAHFLHCEPHIGQKRVEQAIVRASKDAEREAKQAEARALADAATGAADAGTCPTCRNRGYVERAATPREVDEGCELGVAFDPCPDELWHATHPEHPVVTP